MHRVMAAYRPEDARSGWLPLRLGFGIEGFARDYLLLDAAWRDHVLTAKERSGQDTDTQTGRHTDTQTVGH